MGWEKRGNKKYYYRKKRVGKKVISQYFGTGPEAERIAQEDELSRRIKMEEREEKERREAEEKLIDDVLDDLIAITKKLIDMHLLLAGFHCHRGEWRLKRNGR